MSILNRRAKFDYEIKETYIAGLVLESNEVKPLRQGKASIQSSFINEQKGEIFINNFEIISLKKNFDGKKKIKSVKKLHPNLPVIGVGGVMSKLDFNYKIESGADLVQIYTGFIINGPKIVSDILSH